MLSFFLAHRCRILMLSLAIIHVYKFYLAYLLSTSIHRDFTFNLRNIRQSSHPVTIATIVLIFIMTADVLLHRLPVNEMFVVLPFSQYIFSVIS